MADSGLTGVVIALVIDPYDSTTLYALNRDNGLFKTSDGAASWNELQTGLLDGNCYGVALSTRNPAESVLYNVVAGDLENFLAGQRRRDRVVPRFVEGELRKFLECGF